MQGEYALCECNEHRENVSFRDERSERQAQKTAGFEVRVYAFEIYV
jgi:hypothetical protein